ncbi:magnesium-dependent phosphatase-1 [Parachaetomium inaequale]|uniref:Magnesium-dependent phosphatase-1 n=1 Tax=Parachaetomium inaequale TaxID=2588326 RepID=A0AAN6P892_9PEZI|nr:magnesium-dependent phosphatase-1 [Parachaetomium inaequale]
MAKSKKLAKATSNDPSPLPRSSTTPTPSWLHDGHPLPRLIVLDLDYTLWPFYSDIHIAPPIRLIPNSNPPTLADRNGEHFALYPDAPAILRLVASLPNTRLAVASKSPVGDLCREVLKLLRLPPPGEGGGSEKGPKRAIDAFDAGLEIYEGSKLRHFEVISKRTGIPFSQMLFFDDERPNLEVESLGVTMRLIRDGLTWEELERGMMQWRGNQGAA